MAKPGGGRKQGPSKSPSGPNKGKFQSARKAQAQAKRNAGVLGAGSVNAGGGG